MDSYRRSISYFWKLTHPNLVVSTVANVPSSLIYETINGEPIYYRGYKEVLVGKQQLAVARGSTVQQSYLIGELFFLLKRHLDRNTHHVLGNEVGLQLAKHTHCLADLAVVKGKLVTEEYLSYPPELVVRIDTKADVVDMYSYYVQIARQLLKFQVPYVIWIFTATRTWMYTEKGRPWTLHKWTDEVPLWEGLSVRLDELVETF